MPHLPRLRTIGFTLVLSALALFAPSPLMSTADGQEPAPSHVVPLEDFSPGFLGMYRKVMEIEDQIIEHAEKYGVDVTLARALCLQESGGNANLNSRAGAKGYFQVIGHLSVPSSRDQHRSRDQVRLADDPTI